MVDVAFVEPLEHAVTLARMRAEPRLVGMELLRKGSRLSVQPVMPHEWNIILELSKSAQ
jgi:predicted RNA-binding protein with PUA-like domain